MTFKERIQEGLDGKYQGLSNGLNRINNYIFNIQRSCYTLIGGLSGSAKTTLVDFMLMNALEDAIKKNININVFYYSYEINETRKKAIWLSALIYKKYGLVIKPEAINGFGSLRLTPQELSIVEKVTPELDSLFNKITWRWESVNPTGMYKEWWNFMSNRGTFEKEPYTDEFGNPKERIVKFIPANPDEYNIIIVDHIALCKHERGFTLKDNLDKLSEYAVTVRNLFGMSIFFLQQFNQGLSNIDRIKFKGVDLSPQQSDFKDSTNPYTDSDVALGLLNAHQMGMTKCLDYNIDEDFSNYNLKDKFRMLKVIKNRLSRDNISIGLLFRPEAGSFEELPLPKDLTNKDIERINNLIKAR